MAQSVLVVDDDAGIRELLKFKLSKGGFDVETSANGRECLDSLRTRVPDVVLLDVRMPRVDGLETLDAIRTEFDSALPVVLLTGADPDTDSTTTMATERISKPFTMEEVRTCIERVLDE